MKTKRNFLSFVSSFVFTFSVTVPCYTEDLLQTNSEGTQLDFREVFIKEVLALQGLKNLNFEKNRFTWDCSGVVLASLWKSGLDLRKLTSVFQGGGVERLFAVAKSYQLVHDFLLPELGDLIFWDNTYDKNEDKLWNDPLTHVGVVVEVHNDGTIVYLHHDYKRGIVTARMNLFLPDVREIKEPSGETKTINSPMRMEKDRYLAPEKWLSSHLFRGFVSIRFLALPLEQVLAKTE